MFPDISAWTNHTLLDTMLITGLICDGISKPHTSPCVQTAYETNHLLGNPQVLYTPFRSQMTTVTVWPWIL